MHPWTRPKARAAAVLALALAALALAVVPHARAGTPGPADPPTGTVVTIGITNSSPDTLMLTDSRLSGSGVGPPCWTDNNGNCHSHPPDEIDPGDSSTIYVGGGSLSAPSGFVNYRVIDSSSGFFGSGIRIDFADPPTSASSASCSDVGFYACSGFGFNTHGQPLEISTSVVATHTCPGSGDGPCGYTSDATWGSPGSGNGQFNRPTGVGVDGLSFVYVTDTGNSRVQAFTPDGRFITGWGSAGFGPGQFQRPTGVTTLAEPSGSSTDVLVADPGTGTLSLTDTVGTSIATFGSGNGLAQPSGVAIGPNGDVYVLDTTNNRVQVLTAAYLPKTNWGSQGSGPGQFQGPQGIDVDAQGNVYVADTGNNRVQQFSADGTFAAAIGGPGSGLGQFSQPAGVAALGSGAIAVTDSGNDRVQLFSGPNLPILTWGVPGSDAGEFESPQGISSDGRAWLYVADTGNNRIQAFAFSPSQVTIAAPRAGRPAGPVRPLRLRARRGRARVPLRCATNGPRRCHGVLTLHNRRGLLARRAFAIRAGRRTALLFRLSRPARQRSRLSGRLLAHTRQTDGRTRITHERRVQVRRAR
jgi:NHL repeat